MAHEYPRYWYISNPRSSDGSWGQWVERYEQEYPRVFVDLAKPGSDQTAVSIMQQPKNQIAKQAINDAYAALIRQMNDAMYRPPPILVTKEEAARLMPVPSCSIAEAAFPKQSEPDRIWDLIVLAARSSRYG